MTPTFHHDDRLAIIAATSALGLSGNDRHEGLPLAPREWNKLAQWLHQRNLQPASLLDPHEKIEVLLAEDDPELANRITKLHDHAVTVSFELERFEHRGIWVLARFDDAYPSRWRDILKGLAPPVLFGVGPDRFLNPENALAIVGSRDISPDLMETVESLGRVIARSGAVMVSGGARGSDRAGMTGAITDGDGEVVGVLSGDLDRLSRQRDVRGLIADERLCLVCHAHPGAGFSAGNAMARNKLIYTQADATFVMATSEGKGGTWGGATETLKRRWAPVIVWTGEGAPAANSKLIDLGAFPMEQLPTDAAELTDLVAHAREAWQSWKPAAEKPLQPSLFDET